MENFRIKNEYGAITVVPTELKKAVVKGIKNSKQRVVITNSNGNPLRKGASFLDIKEADFVELFNTKDKLNIEIFLLIKKTSSPSIIANKIVENIEEVIFDTVGAFPNMIVVNIKKDYNRIIFDRKKL